MHQFFEVFGFEEPAAGSDNILGFDDVLWDLANPLCGFGQQPRLHRIDICGLDPAQFSHRLAKIGDQHVLETSLDELQSFQCGHGHLLVWPTLAVVGSAV
ncbi:hypothetical protein D3C87_1950700 [compost metagenome]